MPLATDEVAQSLTQVGKGFLPGLLGVEFTGAGEG